MKGQQTGANNEASCFKFIELPTTHARNPVFHLIRNHLLMGYDSKFIFAQTLIRKYQKG